MFCSDNPKVQTNWWPATNGAAMWPLYVPIPENEPSLPAVTAERGERLRHAVRHHCQRHCLLAEDRLGLYDPRLRCKRQRRCVGQDGAVGSDVGQRSRSDHERFAGNLDQSQRSHVFNADAGLGRTAVGSERRRPERHQVGTNFIDNEPDSSCMSCHGPAEWQPEKHAMLSFLLPSFPNPATGPNNPPFKLCPKGKGKNLTFICSPAPGSPDWSRWFQDRNGTEPQDPNTGSIATDYDMVFAFKTLPAWWKAMGPANTATPLGLLPLRNGFNQYSGAPLKPSH